MTRKNALLLTILLLMVLFISTCVLAGCVVSSPKEKTDSMPIINIWKKAGSPAIVNSTVGKIYHLANKVYNEKGRLPVAGIFDFVQVNDAFINGRKREVEEFVSDPVLKEKQLQICELLLSVSKKERLSAVALFHGWINRAGQEQPGH